MYFYNKNVRPVVNTSEAQRVQFGAVRFWLFLINSNFQALIRIIDVVGLFNTLFDFELLNLDSCRIHIAGVGIIDADSVDWFNVMVVAGRGVCLFGVRVCVSGTSVVHCVDIAHHHFAY
jgi:hypothetical protein